MPLFALGALGTSPGKGQGVGESISTVEAENETLNRAQEKLVERRLRLKVDIRLCTIAGIICSFNLLDSGIISSGSVTSMTTDLSLEGTRWRQMIFLRILLGISNVWGLSGSDAGEVLVLASGNIMNFGLNHLDGQAGLEGGESNREDPERQKRRTPGAIFRVQDPGSFSRFQTVQIQFSLLPLEPGVNLPIILSANHPGMGFDANKSILLSAPPYYYAVIPVLLTSLLGDKLRLRGPLIFFNSLSFIAGFLILGFPTSKQVTVRSIGTFLSTGAYVSNWAALNAYLANNIVGQWKRATVAASVTASKGLGGIADSFIVRSSEALTYETAVWVLLCK
ncbi:hypothetical protein GX48_01316 [Paracoccidioides brasiliensis]|nr:hypothetical protein GX48_01316 [Paracoccidioides brasiliensis]